MKICEFWSGNFVGTLLKNWLVTVPFSVGERREGDVRPARGVAKCGRDARRVGRWSLRAVWLMAIEMVQTMKVLTNLARSNKRR